MSHFHAITDYARTERVVLVVDLNTTVPTKHILAAINKLFYFQPFSCSPTPTLFAYKCFSSSLSPLLFSSKLPNYSHPLSFDLPLSTSFSSQLPEQPSTSLSPPRAPYVAACLRQLLYDYSWDPPDSTTFDSVSSNLVLLFSPAPKSAAGFFEFFQLETTDGALFNSSDLSISFNSFFQSIRDAYRSRDIHFSWVDTEADDGTSNTEFEFFKKSLRALGWGYCNMNSIIYGSTLVPFGLIYPAIGTSPKLFDLADSGVPAQLKLSIVDVDGKPLECSYCDVALIHLRHCSSTSINSDLKSGATAKICVKAIGVSRKMIESRWALSDLFLVKEHFQNTKKEGRNEESSVLIEEKVLELLGVDVHHSSSRRMPLWQLLLVFLYRENLVAMISFTIEDAKPFSGVLKPLTISSALLSFIKDQPCQIQTENIRDAGCRSASRCTKNSSRKNVDLLKNLSWQAFRDSSLENFQVGLEDIYLGRSRYKSKKLKFLRCWMKQMMKNPASLEVEEPMDSSTVAEPQPVNDCSAGACKPDDEAPAEFRGENDESFLANLPAKIQEGLRSEEVDLESLAERLVEYCLDCLYRKHGISRNEIQNACRASVLFHLSENLLKDPEEFAALDALSDAGASKIMLREIELQILFRMELLLSEIGRILDKPAVESFVKQICTFLEVVEFRQDGSLKNLLDKMIKIRYSGRIGDIVKKIYTEMDITLNSDNDEALLISEESDSGAFLISEESSHSYRRSDEMNNARERAESSSSKLQEAEERRQRARRFSSFTTWVPDLRRIWAPKHVKPSRTGSARSKKRSRRKEERSLQDVVLETPVAASKRSGRVGRKVS